MTIKYDFLPGGGEMGERIRAHDWSNTAIGPIEAWSPALRMQVSFLLANRFPVLLWWGPTFCSIYNDAYVPVLGAKHPWALGRPVSECWSEIWDVLKPLIETPFNGGPSTWIEDFQLEIRRHGYLEEGHFTVAYSPVPDDTAPRGIGGVVATVHEISGKVFGERRVAALRDLGSRAGEAKTAEQACAIAAATLSAYDKDLPFVLLYLIDSKEQVARLAGTAGVAAGTDISPLTVGLGESQDGGWPLAEARDSASMTVVESLSERFSTVPRGPWSDSPHAAIVVPIPSNRAHDPSGLLVAGLSPRLSLDEHYRNFFELLRTQLATAIANVRAYEEEKKRAEALAEIDRAKTAFFSNVSHEFRTPVTLMLGPVDEILAKGEGGVLPENRALLEVVQRNGHRLLKLVNTLLDFSRIEAERAEARYEPVDLAALTADLASNFRAACERAGLKLTVDCAALAEPALVDREMWEKIVLNLISNAFKFTFKGGITVQVRDAGKRFELTVSDSGVGIPAEELPRMFERFHRVAGTRGRSHEGSGIGLALVQELVKLHGGDIDVRSAPGKGATFTVSIPKGSAHLRSEQIAPGRSDRVGSGAGAYVEEALSWLTGTDPVVETAEAAGKQRILLADDNADLREYARRLLAEHYDVETVSNGEAALEAARERRPDLIVTDVMMPQLDGFGLIRALRADAALFDVPVVVLSARAGDEARIEGLDEGADDYLVKPFSARELIVRVEALLRSAKIRRRALEEEREAADVLRDTDRRKDEFLATLSHELRNSLTPVCNAVELLGLANGDVQLIAEARGILARQVTSLVRLVDDLLELSRISQGSIELRKSAVDLASIVASSVETSGPAIAAAGHELKTTLPERPVMLYADSVRITQILANLQQCRQVHPARRPYRTDGAMRAR